MSALHNPTYTPDTPSLGESWVGQKISAHHVGLCVLFLAAFIIRLVFAAHLPPEKTWGDAGTYDSIARHLIAGNGYASGPLDAPNLTRQRPPTYPIFVAIVYLIFGPNPKAVVLVQTLLGSCIPLLAYGLGCRIFDRRAGLLAASILAVYPALIYYDTRLLREGLTAFLITWTLFLSCDTQQACQRASRLISVGVLLAAVSMCRPETLVLAGPVVYLIVGPTRNLRPLLRPALLVALPILLVWLPWTIRNYVAFGTLSPISSGIATTIWFGSRWAEIGGDDHTSEDRKDLRQQTHLNNVAARKAYKARMKAEGKSPTEPDMDTHFSDKVIQDILNRPGWFATMIVQKGILFWKDANGVKKTLPKIHPALPGLLNFYYYGLLVLAVFALVFSKGHKLKPLVLIVVTNMAVYALLHVRNRYRVPILPLVFILSAGGFWALYDLSKAYFHARIASHTKPGETP